MSLTALPLPPPPGQCVDNTVTTGVRPSYPLLPKPPPEPPTPKPKSSATNLSLLPCPVFLLPLLVWLSPPPLGTAIFNPASSVGASGWALTAHFSFSRPLSPGLRSPSMQELPDQHPSAPRWAPPTDGLPWNLSTAHPHPHHLVVQLSPLSPGSQPGHWATPDTAYSQALSSGPV